jgi:hypothetical protein
MHPADSYGAGGREQLGADLGVGAPPGRSSHARAIARQSPAATRRSAATDRCAGILYRVSADAGRRPLRSGAMAQNRMSREEFFAKLAPLDAEQRGKILWNL